MSSAEAVRVAKSALMGQGSMPANPTLPTPQGPAVQYGPIRGPAPARPQAQATSQLTWLSQFDLEGTPNGDMEWDDEKYEEGDDYQGEQGMIEMGNGVDGYTGIGDNYLQAPWGKSGGYTNGGGYKGGGYKGGGKGKGGGGKGGGCWAAQRGKGGGPQKGKSSRPDGGHGGYGGRGLGGGNGKGGGPFGPPNARAQAAPWSTTSAATRTSSTEAPWTTVRRRKGSGKPGGGGSGHGGMRAHGARDGQGAPANRPARPLRVL